MSSRKYLHWFCEENGKCLSRFRWRLTNFKIAFSGVNYPCGQCHHQATLNENSVWHKKVLHEGIKYPCEQCQHNATSNGNLAQHRREVHEDTKYPCEQCEHPAIIKKVLISTKEQFMKV